MRLRTKLLISAGAAIAGAGIVKIVQTMRDRQQVERRTRTAADMVGRNCRVTTQEVSTHFGQGIVDDGGPGLILSIRCEEPNDLERSDIVTIVSYHSGSDSYTVERSLDQDANAEETAA